MIRVSCPANQHPESTNQEKTALKQMCRPCLIIIRSCYFEYRANKPFTCSPLDLRFVLCSRGLDVVRAQRIIGFFNHNCNTQIKRVRVGSPGEECMDCVITPAPLFLSLIWQASKCLCGTRVVQLFFKSSGRLYWISVKVCIVTLFVLPLTSVCLKVC